MVDFTCNTCSVSLEAQEMLKHLSVTRHKSVMHNPSQETLECERCQDTNIHQLIIIRYGGQDISQLCQTCFAKEDEKPSTQYTLQNGSILRNVENYFKVRDLSCVLCDNDSHLYVDKNDPSFVACYKCIKEKDLGASKQLIKESDENFLYVLLGIKEHVKASKTFKRQRKVGRSKKGKKFGGGGRRQNNKGAPPSKTGTPSASRETLRTFQALSKSEVDKIKPVDEKNEIPTNIIAKSSKPQHSTRGNKSPISRSSGRSTGKNTPKTKQGPNEKSTNKANKKFVDDVTSGIKNLKVSKPNSQDKKESNKKEVLTKPEKGGSNGNSTKKSHPKSSPRDIPPYQETNPKTDVTRSEGQSKSGRVKQQTDKTSPRKESASGKKGPKLNHQSTPKGTVSKAAPISRKEVKASKDGKLAESSKVVNNLNDKTSKRAQPKSNKTKDSNPQNNKEPKTKKSGDNDKSKVSKLDSSKLGTSKSKAIPSLEEDYEELEHIPKYLSNKPQLSYDSLDEYFKEMCFHLYLEEKLVTSPITEFSTEWHKDNKNLFKVTIPYTEEIEKLVPPKLRNIGKLPFSINQSIFVAKASDKDNIWDCFVKDLNLTKRHGKKIELLLELYKWNNSDNFPIGSKSLSIVPCSATITRILFAMARIENPKFIKMLLGKEPIRQINFKNRLQFTKTTFNDSQKNAIQHVLNNAITVLQGPPGTGKTSTIYEIILQLLRNLKTFPILVVAASNIAIDNIAEKLKQDDDLTILRIVSTEKEREYNDKHHLYDICLHQQVFNRLPERNKEIYLDMKFNRKPVSQNQYKKLLTVSNSITEKLVAQAQVILTTTVVAGGYQLKSIKKLPVVVMDESTQSSEACSLIPLSMPGVDRFIFVGDDKQLSSFSEVPYLEQSLFERVLKNDTYKNPHLLNVQYRMHPKISEFPIKEFYNKMLSDGVTEQDRGMEGIDPLVFVDYGQKFRESKVSNYKRFNGGGYTYTNHGEADLILDILKNLVYAKNIDKKDISIITPYSAQRDLLATTIQKDDLINPNNEEIEEEVDEDSLTSKKPTTIKTICNIMVSSIDAFQGREKNFIIFSCVRSNDENKIGFVKDARRLNVALTRARNGLILVGNKECMRQGDELWSKLVSHLDSNKSIVSEDYFKV